MKTRRGWLQGYNAQAMVTPEQIILGKAQKLPLHILFPGQDNIAPVWKKTSRLKLRLPFTTGKH
jgi:hypothetical protein